MKYIVSISSSSSSFIISLISLIVVIIIVYIKRSKISFTFKQLYNFVMSIFGSLNPLNLVGAVGGVGVPYQCPKDRFQQGALCYNKSDVPGGYDWSGASALGQITKICPDISKQAVPAITVDNCSYEQKPYPLQCPDNLQQSGLLCYDKCPSDKPNNVAGVCWPNCPNGFIDFGAGCTKPESYGNGVGYVPKLNDCPPRSHSGAADDCYADVVDREDGVNGAETWGSHRDKDDGCSWNRHIESSVCFRACPQGYFGRSYERCAANGADSFGVMRRVLDRGTHCDNDDQNIAGLCYKKCRSGFHYVGGNVCSPDCPSGYTDSGVSCTKNTSNVALRHGIDTCPKDHSYKSGALCYDAPVKNQWWEFKCMAGNCNLARDPKWPTPYTLFQGHSCPDDHPDDEGNSGLCYQKPPSYYKYTAPNTPIPFENCGLGLCHKPFLTSSIPLTTS